MATVIPRGVRAGIASERARRAAYALDGAYAPEHRSTAALVATLYMVRREPALALALVDPIIRPRVASCLVALARAADVGSSLASAARAAALDIERV